MIDFKSTLKMAVVSLKINKMRSMLTSLGIIIGVSAVIIMLAVGTGAREKVQKDMESMGSNLLTIRSASAKTGGVRMGMGTRPTLTIKDAEAIKKNARGISAVSSVSTESKQLTYGNQNWASTVYGINPEYFYIKNYEIDMGRGFTPEDIKNSAKVAVIGATVASELFGDLDPRDRIMRVGGIPFKVIGTLKSKGSMGPMDQDDLIFIPITTAQKKVFGTTFPGTVSMIVVKGSDPDDVSLAEQDIEELLVARHRIGKNQENDFEIRNSAEFQEKMKSTVQTFAILLASIASVSLLVGGIGIMNIMLVSVTERTKEIGIRMAIGAKPSDIRVQFLIESFLLSIIGGLIGVAVGILGAELVQISGVMSVSISLFSIVLSLGFSGAIGVLFGYYPAYKASLLNPIDALRYE
ncbi:export ABC transporter permease protein [Clostridium sp. CAG:768]|uniref:ABC transporter permease n=1 Tax=Candidatus Stercorousia sp. TaxID=3048886 RepID=UPI00033661CE|nr:export ABC transporter permease protein [Clostridium sp. CAG:768]